MTERFERLAAEWEAATQFMSSTTQMSMHPAYQQIIGIGPDAIPLILGRMQAKPGHWFWALRAITCQDPVAPEDAGNVQAMTDAWLVWGRERGFLLE
jgi:hypothetical protein